jgi:hypothetical protein
MAKRLLLVFLFSGILAACSTTITEAPTNCRISSDDATTLAETYLSNNSLDWGDPIRIRFDGGRFRLVYETPQGADERALIVDCNTGTIVPG